MKQRIAVATIPGVLSGSTMRRNAWVRDAPSIHAASSRSFGMSSMNPIMIHTPKGIVITRWERMIPAWVLSRPTCL